MSGKAKNFRLMPLNAAYFRYLPLTTTDFREVSDSNIRQKSGQMKKEPYLSSFVPKCLRMSPLFPQWNCPAGPGRRPHFATASHTALPTF